MVAAGIYDHIFFTNRQAFCNLCKVYVPNNNYNIKQHTRGNIHNIKGLMIINGIYEDNVGPYCKICKEGIDNFDDIESHVYESDHSNNISSLEELLEAEYMDLESFLSNEDSNIHCSACNCDLSYSYINIETHIAGSRHRSNRCNILEPLNGIFQVENTESEVWCKICDKYIENSVDDVLEHIDYDSDHNSWLDDIDDIICDENISIDAYLENISIYQADCSKCNVKVPVTELNLREHVDGSNHQNS